MTDEEAMRLAIAVARRGERRSHRPFGAVVLNPDGFVLGEAYGTESRADPTRHSEMLAIRMACSRLGCLLHGRTLVSTHQPCPMCAGAIIHAKLGRVIWGSYRTDLPELFRPKNTRGILMDTGHPPEVIGGVLRDECIRLFDREVARARLGPSVA